MAAGLVLSCSATKPAAEPSPAPPASAAPAPSASASAAAAAPAPAVEAPPGFVPMEVGMISDEDPALPRQGIFFEGDHGSMPSFVSREAWELARAHKRGEVPQAQRAPFDAWIAKTLGSDGAFVRAEISLRGDDIVLTLFVKRGDKVEGLEASKDNGVPAILLAKIPLFVEIKLLKEVGGWVEHGAGHAG